MTMKLKDLLAPFNELTVDQQLAKIHDIRNHRTIERPVAAKKRQIKKAKKSVSTRSKLDNIMKKLTEEQRAVLIAKLQGK